MQVCTHTMQKKKFRKRKILQGKAWPTFANSILLKHSHMYYLLYCCDHHTAYRAKTICSWSFQKVCCCLFWRTGMEDDLHSLKAHSHIFPKSCNLCQFAEHVPGFSQANRNRGSLCSRSCNRDSECAQSHLPWK